MEANSLGGEAGDGWGGDGEGDDVVVLVEGRKGIRKTHMVFSAILCYQSIRHVSLIVRALRHKWYGR